VKTIQAFDRRKEMKKFVLLLLVALLSLTVFAQGASETKVPQDSSTDGYRSSVDFLEIYSGSYGGSMYLVGADMALVLEENLPGLSAKTAIGGGTANPGIIQSKQGMSGMIYTGVAYEAYTGTGSWSEAHPDLRHAISVYSLPFLWIVLDESRITSIYDLADKRISPGKTGQTGLVVAEASLNVHGITFDSVVANGGTVSLLGDSDRINMLRDRNIDAFSGLFPVNYSELQSLSLNPGVRIIGLDPATIPEMLEKVPGAVEVVIPAGTFNSKQTEDIHTVALVSSWIVNKDLDDEFVYQAVKALYNNQEPIAKNYPATDNQLSTPLAGKVPEMPVHPGAQRFFDEMGIK